MYSMKACVSLSLPVSMSVCVSNAYIHASITNPTQIRKIKSGGVGGGLGSFYQCIMILEYSLPPFLNI